MQRDKGDFSMRLFASTLAIGALALALPLMAAQPADAGQFVHAPATGVWATGVPTTGVPATDASVIQADWNGYHHDWHHHWRHEYRGDYDHHWHRHWYRPPPRPYGYYAPPPPPGYGYGYR
jgi:hypothetical protein